MSECFTGMTDGPAVRGRGEARQRAQRSALRLHHFQVRLINKCPRLPPPASPASFSYCYEPSPPAGWPFVACPFSFSSVFSFIYLFIYLFIYFVYLFSLCLSYILHDISLRSPLLDLEDHGGWECKPATRRGVAWRGVAWRGAAWRGVAPLTPLSHCHSQGLRLLSVPLFVPRSPACPLLPVVPLFTREIVCCIMIGLSSTVSFSLSLSF